MAPFRPKSALGASVSQAQLPVVPSRPKTSLLQRSSKSETTLSMPGNADPRRAPPPPRLQRSESAKFRRQRSAAGRRLISCLNDECPGISNSVRFLPRHQIHDRRFYRCNQENFWNNIWRVPKSRLKYLTPIVNNQYAIDAIDARFHEQRDDDKDEERLRRERHDEILSQFRVQRLKNVKRDLRCRYPTTCLAGRREPLAIRIYKTESAAALHQKQICDRLSHPRQRRNRPECSSSDMIEYRGLIVGDDIDYFYKDQYDTTNAALAYAHDVYRSMFPDQEKMQETNDEMEVHEGRPVRCLRRRQSTGSITKIADETRRELNDFETRLIIANRGG